MNIKEKTIAELKLRRSNLMIEIVSMDGAIMRGSLIERYIRCGKTGCKCSKGPGHGPKYYLSVSIPGKRPEQIYVPQRYLDSVKEYLSKYQELKSMIEEISNINREILRRREELK